MELVVVLLARLRNIYPTTERIIYYMIASTIVLHVPQDPIQLVALPLVLSVQQDHLRYEEVLALARA